MVTSWARGSGSGAGSDDLWGSAPSDMETHDFISFKVSKFIMEEIPCMFGTIQDQLIAVFDVWYVPAQTTIGGSPLWTWEVTFHELYDYGDLLFMGRKDPTWILLMLLAFARLRQKLGS